MKNNFRLICANASTAKWFGVTYKEDKEHVQNEIEKLINNKEYPAKLW